MTTQTRQTRMRWLSAINYIILMEAVYTIVSFFLTIIIRFNFVKGFTTEPGARYETAVVYISNVSCMGYEDKITQCFYSSNDTLLSNNEAVGVLCKKG